MLVKISIPEYGELLEHFCDWCDETGIADFESLMSWIDVTLPESAKFVELRDMSVVYDIPSMDDVPAEIADAPLIVEVIESEGGEE